MLEAELPVGVGMQDVELVLAVEMLMGMGFFQLAAGHLHIAGRQFLPYVTLSVPLPFVIPYAAVVALAQPFVQGHVTV